jgi:hypothetical protein
MLSCIASEKSDQNSHWRNRENTSDEGANSGPIRKREEETVFDLLPVTDFTRS